MAKVKPKPVIVPDHYATLGVPKTAAPDEIKRAYRKRARNAHPDKGGTDAEMAALNRAYDTLSEPQRRLTYDQTGQDEAPQVDELVQHALLEAFEKMIDSNVERDRIGFVRKHLRDRREMVDRSRSDALSAQKNLTKRRAKVRTKPGKRNLYHVLIDQKLQVAAQALAQTKTILEALDAALKLLDDYGSDDDVSELIASSWSTAKVCWTM